MRRKITRLRQEFLERKQNETVHDAIHKRKQQLSQAIETASPLPGHLKKDATALKKFVELDDDQTKDLRTTIDDEYALAGVEDPRVLITTSREGSQKLLEFAKELRLVIPNGVRLNRGSTSVQQLMDAVRKENYTDVIVVSESQGVPDTITISHLPLGPTASFTIHNLVTRHDIENVGPMSEQAPHLVFENFTTPLGKRFQNILAYLFPVPRESSTRVVTFDNQNDFISFRNHGFKKGKNASSASSVVLQEVGPRFELTPFRIMLGTLDMADADEEFVMRPYMNTAKKRKML